jgi:hypothetical protein
MYSSKTPGVFLDILKRRGDGCTLLNRICRASTDLQSDAWAANVAVHGENGTWTLTTILVEMHISMRWNYVVDHYIIKGVKIAKIQNMALVSLIRYFLPASCRRASKMDWDSDSIDTDTLE